MIREQESDLAVSRVAGPTNWTSWYYDSVTDRMLYQAVTSANDFTSDLKIASGLTGLKTAAYVTVDSLTKSSVSGRVDEVE